MADRSEKLISTTLVLILLIGILVIPGTAAAYQEGGYTYTISGSPAFATITDYTGPGGEVIIPSTLGGYPTEVIDEDAFSWSGLTSVVIPSSVTAIGFAGFYHCSALESVILGAGIMNISYGAFYGCPKLATITFLGLSMPSIVGEDWIAYTDPGIRGHAYAASDFPPPGEIFHNLTMGAVIVVPPGAPTSLTAEIGDGFVLLNWTAPPLAEGSGPLTYHLFRNGTMLWSGAALAFNDSTALNDVNYTYQVAAENSAGWGPNSTSLQAMAIALALPTMPTAFHVSAGNGFANLSWSPPANAGSVPVTSYKIYRGTNVSLMEILTLVQGTSYNDTTVLNGQRYYYQVRASSSVGDGGFTETISVIPDAPAPPPPSIDNTMIYVAVGALVVVVALVMALFLRKRS